VRGHCITLAFVPEPRDEPVREGSSELEVAADSAVGIPGSVEPEDRHWAHVLPVVLRLLKNLHKCPIDLSPTFGGEEDVLETETDVATKTSPPRHPEWKPGYASLDFHDLVTSVGRDVSYPRHVFRVLAPTMM
jgi:hypothetical protein